MREFRRDQGAGRLRADIDLDDVAYQGRRVSRSAAFKDRTRATPQRAGARAAAAAHSDEDMHAEESEEDMHGDEDMHASSGSEVDSDLEGSGLDDDEDSEGGGDEDEDEGSSGGDSDGGVGVARARYAGTSQEQAANADDGAAPPH